MKSHQPLENRRLAILAGLVLLIALIQSHPLQAQAPVVILTDERGEYPLGLHLEILQDQGGELTIEDVSSAEFDEQFVPSQDKVPNFGYTTSIYWARFRVRNDAGLTTEWRLALSFPNMNYIDLYIPVPDQQGPVFTVKRSGNQLPFAAREVNHRHHIFELPLAHAEQTIYLRFKSQATMTLPITLWSLEAFTQKNMLSSSPWGFTMVFC